MAEITAAAVMALRDKTGLPMMECKKALQECGGNTEQAVEWLRKQGVKTQAMRADRETSTGRLAVYADPAKNVGTIIELKCESAPVANSPDFKALAEDIATTLADTFGDVTAAAAFGSAHAAPLNAPWTAGGRRLVLSRSGSRAFRRRCLPCL